MQASLLKTSLRLSDAAKEMESTTSFEQNDAHGIDLFRPFSSKFLRRLWTFLETDFEI